MNNIIRLSVLLMFSLLATLANAEPTTPKSTKDQPATNGASTTNGVTQTANEPGKININTASATELRELKGVGQKRAEQIVKDREMNGPFASAQDLTRIKGIGPKTVAKNLDKISIGAPATPASKSEK